MVSVCRLQLRALAEVKRRLLDRAAFSVPPKLYLIGGCRHEADRMRAAALRTLAASLGVADDVELMVNAPFEDMLRVLGSAAAGLHTMTDEHFGIGVVEYMAAGCVPVAHDSGAPRHWGCGFVGCSGAPPHRDRCPARACVTCGMLLPAPPLERRCRTCLTPLSVSVLASAYFDAHTSNRAG